MTPVALEPAQVTIRPGLEQLLERELDFQDQLVDQLVQAKRRRRRQLRRYLVASLLRGAAIRHVLRNHGDELVEIPVRQVGA